METYTIIANCHVLTCDAKNRGGRLTLLLRDGRIAEVAHDAEALSSLYPKAAVIDATDKLVVPGFVNAHFHAESVLLFPLTHGKHYGIWKLNADLRAALLRLLDPGSADDLRSLYTIASYAHLRGGTTSIGDYPLQVEGLGFPALLQGIDRAGLRAVVALQNWDQITRAREHGARGPRYAVSVGEESNYTVYSLGNAARAARELKVPLLAQVLEQREDAETIRKNFQKNIGTILRDQGILQPSTVLVHMNHATAEDVQAVAQAGSSVVLCARSTAVKRTGYPSLRQLAANPIRLSIGTDWETTDILAEMRFLHELPLLVNGMPSFSAMELLRMATINGAEALGINDEVGSIEVGKRANLVFFSLKGFQYPLLMQRPSVSDLVSCLVETRTARDITDVMVDGRLHVTNGEIMTMPEESIVANLRKLQEKYLPKHVVAPEEVPPPRHVHAPYRSRIVPFVSQDEMGDEEGFEEGFTIVEKAPPPEEPAPAPLPTPPLKIVPSAGADYDRASTRQPELSKNVRRVFGDDDDPGQP